MACRCLRLAAAPANAAERNAGNTRTWLLVTADARRSDFGVMPIPGAYRAAAIGIARAALTERDSAVLGQVRGIESLHNQSGVVTFAR
jgi:hypothetical protein